MMPISRSDREQQTSRLADLKDEYDTREGETVKKKNAELKRNQKKHNEELKETKEAYESRMNDMQGKFYERLTDQDRDNQKKIEDVRSVYASQMRKKMEDTQGEKERVVDTFESEKSHQAKVVEGQKKEIKQKFSDELAVRDQAINDLHKSSRQTMQSTLATRERKLRAAYEKDKNILVAGGLEERQKAADEKMMLKRYYSGEVDGYKKQNQRQKADSDNRFMTTVQSLSQQHSEDVQTRDELLQNEVSKTREKFNDRYAALEDRMMGEGDSFKNNIEERYSDQARSKDAQIYGLKNKMYVEQINQQKRDGMEKDHIVGDYEKKIGIYEQNLNEQKDAFKAINDKNIDAVNKNNAKVLMGNSMTSRIAQNMAEEKHRQDRTAIQEQGKNDLFNMQHATEKRVDTIQKISNDKETQIANYYESYLDTMKEGYMEKLFDQREKHQKDLSSLNEVMNDKFRKLKQTYEQRLDRTTGGYEDKLAKMKDDHAKEIKTITKFNELNLSEKNKSIDTAKNEVEDKYENKIKNLQEQYRVEMERMNDRHQEDMKSLSVKLQNYSRKA